MDLVDLVFQVLYILLYIYILYYTWEIINAIRIIRKSRSQPAIRRGTTQVFEERLFQ